MISGFAVFMQLWLCLNSMLRFNLITVARYERLRTFSHTKTGQEALLSGCLKTHYINRLNDICGSWLHVWYIMHKRLHGEQGRWKESVSEKKVNVQHLWMRNQVKKDVLESIQNVEAVICWQAMHLARVKWQNQSPIYYQHLMGNWPPIISRNTQARVKCLMDSPYTVALNLTPLYQVCITKAFFEQNGHFL